MRTEKASAARIAHTPGEWEATIRDSGEGWHIVHKGDIIATVQCWTDAKEESHANAILMSEAPALLEACKALLLCIGSFAHTGTYPTPEEPEIVNAQGAIAKAEGRQP